MKKVVRELLVKLRSEKFVLDWRKKQRAKREVRLCVKEESRQAAPRVHTGDLRAEVRSRLPARVRRVCRRREKYLRGRVNERVALVTLALLRWRQSKSLPPVLLSIRPMRSHGFRSEARSAWNHASHGCR